MRIEDGSVIESSVLLPSVTIGRRCKITRCILDENCVIPDGMQIGQDPAFDAQALLRHQARRGAGDAGHAARAGGRAKSA